MNCPACDAENAADAESCFTCGRGFDALTLGLVLVGRYEIRRPLGRGGMGRVYEAFDRVLEEPVAIKVLRAELTRDPEISRRFLSEIKLARKVSHRNVCRIHAYHDEAGLNFISMEYLAGRSLKEHLAQQRPTLDEAFELTLQIGQGVAAIHEHGIVHRDLKSGNIMVDAAGVAKIVDFGIAKQVGAAGLTAGDRVFGTPEYMSPEQVEGGAVDGRSDVYALGCVTHEVFTGRPPFQGDSPYATLLKQLKEAPPLDGIPAPLAPMLAKALAKNPADRFASVSDFLAALRAARSATLPTTVAGQRVTLRYAAPAADPLNTMTLLRLPEKRRAHSRWLWAPVVLGALAIGAAILLSRPTQTAPVSAPAATPSTTMSALAATTTRPPVQSAGVPSPNSRPVSTTLARASLPVTLPTSQATPEPRPTPLAVAPTPAPMPAPTTTAPAVITTGTLALILVPDAEVILDGASIGIVERRDVKLEAGPHALEVRHPDYEPLPRRFTIRAAETLTLLLDLQEKGILKAPPPKK